MFGSTFSFLCSFTSFSGSADVYRCTDDACIVMFSDGDTQHGTYAHFASYDEATAELLKAGYKQA